VVGIWLKHELLAGSVRRHFGLVLQEPRDEVGHGAHGVGVGNDFGVLAVPWARGAAVPPLVVFCSAFEIGEHKVSRVRGVVFRQDLEINIRPAP
jgi:hypothetical protein